MKKPLKTLFLSILLINLFMIPLKVNALENKFLEDSPLNKTKCDLKMNQRKLWIDHVLWTRSFIISDISSLEDKSLVLERLLKNQDDIGNSIKSYYGEDAGNKLATLLIEHI